MKGALSSERGEAGTDRDYEVKEVEEAADIIEQYAVLEDNPTLMKLAKEVVESRRKSIDKIMSLDDLKDVSNGVVTLKSDYKKDEKKKVANVKQAEKEDEGEV